MYFTNNLRASVISNEKYVRNYDMTFKNEYSFSLQLSRFNHKRKLSTFGLTDAIFVCMTLCVCVHVALYHIFYLQLHQKHLSLLANFSSVWEMGKFSDVYSTYGLRENMRLCKTNKKQHIICAFNQGKSQISSLQICVSL